MEPFTTALAFLQSSTGLTALAAGTSIYQGLAAAEEGKAEARTAEQNARIARQQAGAREELIRRHNKQKLAEQRAAAAQTGFDPSKGTFLELLGDSAGNLELDALTTRYEGALQALSFDSQAANLRSRARSARVGGFLNAAGSLLGSPSRRYGAPPSLAPVESRTPVPVNRG